MPTVQVLRGFNICCRDNFSCVITYIRVGKEFKTRFRRRMEMNRSSSERFTWQADTYSKLWCLYRGMQYRPNS